MKTKVCIWGAGQKLDETYESLKLDRCELVSIIDSSIKKQGIVYKEIKVVSPCNFQFENVDYIIISVMNVETVLSHIQGYNISLNKIIQFWGDTSQYDFISEKVKENIILKKENESLKLKLSNIRYELGLEERVPKIENSEQLLNRIKNEELSLCRFGDGEFEMLQEKERPWFQKSNNYLAKRLQEVLLSNDKCIIIAIAKIYGNLDEYTEDAAYGIRQYLQNKTREAHYRYLDFERVYYDAYVTRPYLIYNEKEKAKTIFCLWKHIFMNRDVLIVEGKYSRFGINNNLLYDVKSIRRIICPPRNAFDCYEKILNMTKHYAKRDDLILISLGPTATVLAFDLACVGFQAIDIGQLDNEYDWYLRNADKRIAIPGKCVAEINSGIIPLEEIDLTRYDSECVAIIEK